MFVFEMQRAVSVCSLMLDAFQNFGLYYRVRGRLLRFWRYLFKQIVSER